MRAVVLDAPGPPEALAIRDLPVPVPAPGWVLIEVRASGLNRSELHTRLGLAEGVVFPRVPGMTEPTLVKMRTRSRFEGSRASQRPMTASDSPPWFPGAQRE